MWKQRVLTLMVALAAMTAGCKPPAAVPALGGPQKEAQTAAGDRQTLSDPRMIAGVVEFPADRQVQATSADVVNAATLQLIDPATNMTVVSGIMTNGGSGTQTFSLSIPLTFSPSTGQTFLLEAVKGLNSNAPGNQAVRLRTFVQWTNSGWTSTTGSSTIAITAMTTAVALISSIDPANVPPAQTIGDVTYNLGASTFTGALPGHTATEVNNLTLSVNRFISGDVDPVGNTSRLVPQLSGLSVNRGAVGDVVAVYGDGFSPVTGAATVSFNGATVGTYLVRSRTAMYVVVPNGATTGNVTVTTATGVSNGMPFTVSTPGTTTFTPMITGLSTTVARRGDTLTITGYNFDANYSLNTVTLNGNIDLPVSDGSASWIKVTLPNTAVSGPVTVTNVNGTSGAWYLGILTSTTQSVVENFTNAATKDTSVTTLDWTNTGTLGFPTKQQWVQAGADFSAMTTLGASVDTFVGTYQKGGGVGLQRIADSTTYTTTEWRDQFSASPHQCLATNGDIILGLNSSGGLYSYKINVETDASGADNNTQFMGYPFYSESTQNYVIGIAGLQGSNTFYYAPYASVLTTLKTLVVNGHGYTRGPDIALPISINKYSTFTYGHHLGSNGTYLFIWGGQSTGYTTYQSYVYTFAITGTTATLVRVQPLTNVAAYPDNSPNYYPLTGDDRYYYLPGYSTYPYTQFFNQGTGVYYWWTGSLPHNRTSYPYYNVMVYDAKNDCYWNGNPGQVGPYLARLVMKGNIYNTAQNASYVVSPAISLPAGQVWDRLNLDTYIPYNTSMRVDILNGANDALLYTVPAANIDTSSSIRQALAGYTGSIKLRAYLNTTDASMTPYLRSWGVTSAWANPPLAQSNGYDTRVSSGTVKYLSYTVDQPAAAPAITVLFSDSPDGNTWSAWTPNLSGLSRRYIRWQIAPPPDSTYVGPLVNRVQIDYQY